MIENGRVKGVRFVRAHSSGGTVTPRQIVLHDTAGRLDKFSSVKWFASKECPTSAHFVVERDGTVTQMVETNRKAFHAGVSKWKGQTGLNSSSIGIEIVSPGIMDATGKAWFGPCCKPSEIEHKVTREHGDGHWLPYTDAQIAAVKLLCTLIVEQYPDCNEILTHWEISPGRKIDTNPLFPLREVRKAVLDPEPEAAAAIEAAVAPPSPPTKAAVVKEAAKDVAKSPTNQLSVSMIFGWLEMQFGFLRSALPEAKEETEALTDPLTSLGSMLKINLGTIIITLTVLGLVIVLYRNSKRNHELKKLKGEANAE